MEMKISVDLAALVKRAGLTKAEFAKEVGVSAQTVSRWGSSPPRWAEAYLELLIECNRYRL